MIVNIKWSENEWMVYKYRQTALLLLNQSIATKFYLLLIHLHKKIKKGVLK